MTISLPLWGRCPAGADEVGRFKLQQLYESGRTSSVSPSGCHLPQRGRLGVAFLKTLTIKEFLRICKEVSEKAGYVRIVDVIDFH